MADFITAALLGVILTLIIVKMVRNIKSGRGSCSGCASCSMKGRCGK